MQAARVAGLLAHLARRGGREVLARGFLVDSARSYLGGTPPRAIRRRNWGKR